MSWEAWIEPALKHSLGGWTMDEVRAAIGSGELRLRVGDASALLWTVNLYPKGRTAEIVFAGGDGAELVSVTLPAVEAEALALGCVQVQVIGRLGWSRRLKDSGYEPLYTVLAKEL